MKPTDRNYPPGAPLRSLAFASALGAAAFFSTGTSARATLIGHWFSGAESLAETSGFTPAGTHDGVAVGGNAGLLGYSADVPAGFTGKSLDLTGGGGGNVAVQVSNSATDDPGYVNTFDGGVSSQLTVAFWAKGFPGDWAPWISKRGEDNIGWQVRRFGGSSGACFTLRGLDNADGGGSSISVNDNPAKWHHFAAVWDQSSNTRTLYVDGVLSHVVNNAGGQSMNLAANTHLGLGGRQGNGNYFESYFQGLIYDVRIYNNALAQQDVYDLIPQQAPQGLAAVPGGSKVSLSWTASAGATSYTVWTKNTATNAEQTDVVTENSFVKTGLSNGVSYQFKILGTNGGGSSPYSGVISATPTPGSAKDILSFEIGGLSPAKISGTTITKYVPLSVDVTELSATYTISPFATEDANFPSGSVRDFSTPQTYTITAENLSTKVYTVQVIKADPLTYNFDDGLQGWAQIWPLTGNGNLQENGGLGTPEGAGADGADTRYGRSPDIFLNNSGPLTVQLAGGQGHLAAPNLSPSAIPSTAIDDGGFAGVALRDVATNSFVLAKRKSSDGGGYVNVSFSEAELAPFVNDGKRYTLDFLDYNKGGWGWTRLDNVSIPGVLAPELPPTPEANILSFSLSLPSTIKIDGDNITMTLPFGTSVTALAPTYVLSSGATCNKLSGSAQNFSSTVNYTVTSSDSATVHVYHVSAVVMPNPAVALVGHWVSGAESLADSSGYTTAGTHDGFAVGNNAGLLAYAADVPSGFTGKSLDLRAGEVGVSISNSATTDAGYLTTFDDQVRGQVTIAFWAKGFPGTWNPWVAKGGENGAGWQVRRVDSDPVAGFTIRGLGNEDGRGSPINVANNQPVWHHFAGVWDESTGTRSLYVDGVLSHDVNTLGQIMNMAAGRHLTLGARQTDVNGPYGNYFQGLLYDVRIYKQKLFINQVQELAVSPAFTTWINTNYPGLSNKGGSADPDGDGVSNFDEFAFGLNPSSGSSVSPNKAPLNKVTGTFSYTRTNPAVSGLSYKIMTSTDLSSWTEDTAATAGQTVSSTSGDVQTMSVTLSGAPLGAVKLFVRVLAQ